MQNPIIKIILVNADLTLLIFINGFMRYHQTYSYSHSLALSLSLSLSIYIFIYLFMG
jgi:hypothetical protein